MTSGIIAVRKNHGMDKKESEEYGAICECLSGYGITNTLFTRVSSDFESCFEQVMELQNNVDILFVIHETESVWQRIHQISVEGNKDNCGFERKLVPVDKDTDICFIAVRTIEHKQIFILPDGMDPLSFMDRRDTPEWLKICRAAEHEHRISMEEKIIRILIDKNYTLTAAESCTGGLFLGRLINVSGASSVIREGYVTYSEEAKMKCLGVLESTLKKYGVVSEEVAKEMARGAAQNAGAEVGIGITGVAGPGGGSIEKPVGTVCIACYLPNILISKRFEFPGNRRTVRELSVSNALQLLFDSFGLCSERKS